MTTLAVTEREPVGMLMRRWRERRRRSQLDVSLAAEVSTRHLSYIETGRASPSRKMIERLCEELEVPLRERNRCYLAAGFAPAHGEKPFADLGMARAAVEAVLTGLEPNPAAAVNVRWELLAANGAMAGFLGGLPEELSRPPLNVLRATLHPDGLAPRIRNYVQWRAHLLRRVRRQLERTAADGLAELFDELASYPTPTPTPTPTPAPAPAPTRTAVATTDAEAENDLVQPLRMTTEFGEVALLYTVAVFGSPRDVTLDEIAIETFFPADAATADLLRSIADSRA